jgi:hypothetical protein
MKKKIASSSRFLLRSLAKLIRMPTARGMRCPEPRACISYLRDDETTYRFLLGKPERKRSL